MQLEAWKQKHLTDLKEKNTEIEELREQLEQLKNQQTEIQFQPITELLKNKRKAKDDNSSGRESKRLESENNQINKLDTGLTQEVRNWSIEETQNNWTNLHPSFTPQLIQAWQKHNFTYEQTRDWINIHSPADQTQAIQEPEFYAWLRDIKKVDSDWMLNHGNHQALKQEYQASQQQPHILQSTNFPSSSKN